MGKIVSAVYDNRATALAATEGLLAAGFGEGDISVLMSDATQGREFNVNVTTKAPEGASLGAAAGGVLGAIVCTLVALGDLVIPGISLVAAGPIVAALAGAGAGGTLGGLIGAMVGWGIPEHEAKLMAERVAQGGILVGVLTHSDRAKTAREVMRSCGGTHVRATAG
ncbi:MAG: hypothetical protein J0I12_25795 [Candidatus Eremiobacteraeota bacterium]|nr:hypothetical protein [Candidatus Eremiobacteraeota bacterium]